MTPAQLHSDKRLPGETDEQYRARRDYFSKRRARIGYVVWNPSKQGIYHKLTCRRLG